MINPLDYQSTPLLALDRNRRDACTALLVSGILSILMGIFLCLLTVKFTIFTWPGRIAGHVRFAPPPWWFIAIIIAAALTPLILGILSIVCSSQIKRGSRTAARFALAITWIQFLFPGAVAFMFAFGLDNGAFRGLDFGALIAAGLLALGALLQAIPEHHLQHLLQKDPPTHSIPQT